MPSNVFLGRTEKIQIRKENQNVFLGRAVANLKLGDIHGAKSDVGKSLWENPNSKDAHYILGEINMKARDYPSAISDFTKAIHIHFQFAEAYLLRAEAKGASNDLLGALEDLKKAKHFFRMRGDSSMVKQVTLEENKISNLLTIK